MASRLIETHLNILRSLQTERGLFLASPRAAGTGYDKAWLRDNFYETLAFEAAGDWEPTRRAFRAILDIFEKHEYKIERAAAEKPYASWQYIHARYNPETFDEYWEEWGNKQNDAVGAILFKLGELEKVGKSVVETRDDQRIAQRLVDYLSSLRYWEDSDSGMWEENEEVHASSVGACVAGLEAIRAAGWVTVPDELVKKGKETLRGLLPRESVTKFTDLALLSLIWPYGVVSDREASEILKNLEYHLDKRMGVVRYRNDRYYNKNDDRVSEEAEWAFGFSWLSVIYNERGDRGKAESYFEKAMRTISRPGTIPELYYSQSDTPNENNPLGWAESLFTVAAIKAGK